MKNNIKTNAPTAFKNVDLEVLRSTAIILVVINHYPWPFHLEKYFLGYGGVDLFFAISGYIITVGLLRSLKKKQKVSTILKSFWTKRVFRILPMAYLWTLIPIVLAIAFHIGGFGNVNGLIHDGFANVTQTANFHWQECTDRPELKQLCGITDGGGEPLSPFWSLSTEEQFYFIFPLLLLFISRKKLIILLAAIPIILLFVDRQNYFFILRFDAIAVGVLLAFAQTKQWYKEYYPRFLEKRGLGIILLILVLLLIGLVPAWSILPFKQSIVVILAMALVFIASFNMNLFTKSIAWTRPFFLWLGDKSYAIYLIHVPAFVVASEIYVRIFGNQLSNEKFYFPIIAAVLILVSVVLSSRYVETPLRALGRKYAHGIESKNVRPNRTAKRRNNALKQ